MPVNTSAATRPDGPASTRSATRPEWVLVAPAVFALAWGGNHFTPLLHVYQSVGHYSPWQANLLLGMYVFGIIPGLLVAARLSDRLGRRPVLLVGVLASLLGSVVLAAGLSTFVLLCLGRVLAGIGVGVAMSVGTSWTKELSSPPFDLLAATTDGARRSSLTLTLGFAVGAGVTGVLAQYGPWPHVLPYVVHATLATIALVPALRAPETRCAATGAPVSRGLRVPAAARGRFVRLVLPAAPWVFAAAGVAYAVVPASVESRLGDSATIYATVLTVLTLGTGAAVQALVLRLRGAGRRMMLPLGLAMMSAGMLLAVAATSSRDPVFGLVVAMVLGAAYGTLVVAGLVEVQRMAGPDDLAALTGIYYALTYLGFLLPAVLAALLPVTGYPGSLTVVSLLCVACLALVATHLGRRGNNSPAGP